MYALILEYRYLNTAVVRLGHGSSGDANLTARVTKGREGKQRNKTMEPVFFKGPTPPPIPTKDILSWMFDEPRCEDDRKVFIALSVLMVVEIGS